MADFADDFALGEEFVDAEKATVRLAAAVVAGDALEISGVEASTNTIQVRRHSGTNKARFVALRAGAANTYAEVLRRGTVKVTFGADVTPGDTMGFTANKARNQGAGTSSACGYIVSDGAAADDVGLVYFDGGMS